MNIGWVFAVFGTLLALAIALPGLLLAWSLLFPQTVARARQRLEQHPWRCFFSGLLLLLLAFAVLATLFNLPAGPARLLAWLGLAFTLALTSLGGTGLAMLMGSRLTGQGNGLIRGAIALELAVITPLIGWFIVLPCSVICALGAAGLALRQPRPRPASESGEVLHGSQPS